jgi:predicted RNA-binding protein (virulence factor B family)
LYEIFLSKPVMYWGIQNDKHGLQLRVDRKGRLMGIIQMEKIRKVVEQVQALGLEQKRLELAIESASEMEQANLIDEYNDIVRCKVNLINLYEKLRNSSVRYIPQPPDPQNDV